MGEGRGRPATAPYREIETIHKILDARVPALSHPYLREGQRVRITRGPLAGIEDVLVRFKPNKGGITPEKMAGGIGFNLPADL